MSDSGGRPKGPETRRRTARFLALAAADKPYDVAAREAGVDPWRALRLVWDPEFRSVAEQVAGRAA